MPVIKIASNTLLFNAMEDDMDFDAEASREGAGLSEACDGLEELLLRVLDGELTASEVNRQDGIICLYTTHPAF